MDFKLTKEILNRFWSKVDKGGDDACWEWIAGSNSHNYGAFGVGGKMYGAHRVAYYLANKEDPSGLFVCHHCDNTKCCNPKHLFLGTQEDNLRDMTNKGRRVTGDRAGVVNGNAKLTEAQVLEIRDKYAEGEDTYRALAKEYGVHNSSIGRIISKKIWAYI